MMTICRKALAHTSDRLPRKVVTFSRFMARLNIKVRMKHISDFLARYSISRFLRVMTLFDERIWMYSLKLF